MKGLLLLSSVVLLALLLGLFAFLGREPRQEQRTDAVPATSPSAITPLRIGLIPERDIFALRKRNQVLAEYLSQELRRPVVLVTANSYATILQDFADKQVDAAFLGSMVTVLAYDRRSGVVLARTELSEGTSTYTGVICVPENSPIKSVDELLGRSIALVRTTTGGNLFPIYEMCRREMLHGENRPRLIWVGTHDDALDAMFQGQTDAAAVKNLRLAAWLRAHANQRVRILAESNPVPENSLVVRSDIAQGLGRQVADALMDMDKTPKGRAALEAYGARRFLPCSIEDYHVIYELVDQIGDEWPLLKIDGPPPVADPTPPNR